MLICTIKLQSQLQLFALTLRLNLIKTGQSMQEGNILFSRKCSGIIKMKLLTNGNSSLIYIMATNVNCQWI